MLTSATPATTLPAQRATLGSGAALAPSTGGRSGEFSLDASAALASGETLTASAIQTGGAGEGQGRTALRADTDLSVTRQPGQQQKLGRLQQGLDYLDRLAVSVQQLKSGLSDTLARRESPSDKLNGQVEQLRQLWAQRAQEAGGRVDSQLQAATSPDASARQRFKLRGLDLTVLQQGGRETLRLQLPGQAVAQGEGTSTKPVALAVTLQGEGTQEQLQVLAKALAPAGLHLQLQGHDIVFNVAEAQWPALRDGMTLRGEGKRFPSGQPVRAMLEPAAEALQPQRWNLQDASGQREALGQLLQAQPRLAQARQVLGQQLRQVANLGAGTVAEAGFDAPVGADAGAGAGGPATAAATAARLAPAQASTMAGAVTDAMSAMDFGAVGALLPAVQGLHRQRVQQLLTRG